jgi:hypothetical protein
VSGRREAQRWRRVAGLKERSGDQRGGEWEPIKILLQRANSAYTPNLQPRIHTRVCQGHVVTTDLPTLGTNPKRSQSGSTIQEAKDLAALRDTRRTVRGDRADSPRGTGGRSASHGWTVRKRKLTLQYHTSNNRQSAPYPRTVREQLVPRGRSATSRRTVHLLYADGPPGTGTAARA